MPPAPTNAEKMRALRWALGGGAANIVYVHLTFAGPVFLLFLDKLELNKRQIGLVLSLVPFCNLIILLFAPAAAWIGFKRTYVATWTTRKFVMALLMATPWVLYKWGASAAFVFVASVILLFAVCRALAMAGFVPWMQELVPNAVRGRFGAVEQLISIILGAAVLAAAGVFLGDDPQLSGFTVLFGVAFFFGLLSVVLYTRVPGGASIRGDTGQRADFASMFESLRDRQFLLFLAGGAAVALGWAPLSVGAFAPLFFKEQVGLKPNQVLYFNSVLLAAGIFSGFLWGWAADRYGSKPVMLITLAVLWCYPLGLWILPRHDESAFYAALCLAAIIGLALPGYSISYSRLLMVRIIPPDRRSGYTAVHLASMGLMHGLAPLVAGVVIQQSAGLHGSLGLLVIDSYTPLIWSGLILIALAIILLSRVKGDSNVPVRHFAGMFIQGNALAAMQALVTYQFAGVEENRVSTIERLGVTRSPLSIDELIESLRDPSFNVRFEVVVSMARTRPDPKLTDAMIDVLRCDEPDMCIAAAWALGRMGDRRAIEPLREALVRDYPLLRARVARALGSLGDHASMLALLQGLAQEDDVGIKLAYASALGALKSVEALHPLLDLLAVLPEKLQRKEAALAVATIAGREQWFVRLSRSVDRNPGDALAGVILSMRRRILRHLGHGSGGLEARFDACVRAFGEDRLDEGARELRAIVDFVPADRFLPGAESVLRDTSARIANQQSPHLEHLMLIVHVLHTGFGASAEEGVVNGSKT